MFTLLELNAAFMRHNFASVMRFIIDLTRRKGRTERSFDKDERESETGSGNDSAGRPCNPINAGTRKLCSRIIP